MFGWSRKPASRIIFDVGSGSVGAAVVFHEPGKSPHVQYTTRVPLAFQEQVRPERLLDEMLRGVERCAKDTHQFFVSQKTGTTRPKRIEVVLASPWHHSRTHLIKSERPEPFSVTEQYLIDVMGKAKKQYDSNKNIKPQFGGNFVRLEESIMQTILNGYPTSAPYGKQATRMEAAVYLSFVEDHVRHRILEVIERQFNKVDVHLHTFMLISFLAARELHPALNDFLLLDISGEVTDVGLVHDSVLIESASFPWGHNYVLREFAAALGTIPEEAHTLLRMPRETEAVGEEQQRMQQAREQVASAWTEALRRTCEDLAEKEQLPREVLLTASPDFAMWFTELLESDVGKAHTYTHSPFSVTKLGARDIGRRLTFGEGVRYDPFLALESVTLSTVNISGIS